VAQPSSPANSPEKNQPNQKKLIPTPLNFAHSFQIQTPNHQKPYQSSGSEGKSFGEKLFTLALFTFPFLISVSNFSSSFLFRFVSGLVFVSVPVCEFFGMCGFWCF
jgi:hypothetical protein